MSPPAEDPNDSVVKAVAVTDSKQSAKERAEGDCYPERAGNAEPKIFREGEGNDDSAEQKSAAKTNALFKSVGLSVVHDVECAVCVG